MEILSQEGLAFLSRWGHIVSGITWIGLLYYFNFGQVPSVPEFEASTRVDVTRHLIPRVLWWFRWAALATFTFGVLILGFQDHFIGQATFAQYWVTSSGASIYTGALLGTVMLLNVWFVIYPNQRVVIASAEATAAGGQPDPNAPAAARKALISSRTNVVFSGPLVFFMAGTSHFVSRVYTKIEPSALTTYWILVVVVVALIEANGLGLLGGAGAGPLRRPLESVRAVIISSLVLAAVLYVVGWEIILGGS